jgi:hypothetical protein
MLEDFVCLEGMKVEKSVVLISSVLQRDSIICLIKRVFDS